MKLLKLHESFIDSARRPMNFGRLPIKPLEGDVAIVPTEKWEKVKSPTRIRKTFKFMSNSARNQFVSSLFEYEEEIGHHAMMTVDDGQVTLDIRTKDIDQITEIDKEYAKFADVLFKDIVYSPSADDEF